jgi:hypothetical protein
MSITRLSYLGGAMAALFLTAGIPQLRADTLFSQPANFVNSFFSENDTTGQGNYATVFDDFTLSSSSIITSVYWTGSTVNGINPTAFTIDIWANTASNCPGGATSCPNTTAPLYSTTVAGNGGQAFVENDIFNNPTYNFMDPINFSAAAGTEYWLSVVATVASPNDWAWESGMGGDRASYQLISGALQPISADEAFILTSTHVDDTVPEPSTLLFVGGGAFLIFLPRLKRSHVSK